MSPRGAINPTGEIGIFRIFNTINRINTINPKIDNDHGSVCKFNISFVSNKKPNNKKKNALTKNVASITISLSRMASLCSISGLSLCIHFTESNLSRLPRNNPRMSINNKPGKCRYLEMK